MLRTRDGHLDVLVCGRRFPLLWALPKGTPNPGETLEQTAVREVSEETGLEVRALQLIDTVTYWFARDSTRFHKSVHFYLMELAGGGSLEQHDHEFDVVEWFPTDQALRMLTYTNEVSVLQKALRMLQSNAPTESTL